MTFGKCALEWEPWALALSAGLRVVGVNELQTRTAEVASGITQCHVAQGDVCSDEVVADLWKAVPREAGLAAGFSCQPFSNLGDQKGRHDSRAKTLIGALRIAFLTQAPWIILECVAPTGTNEFVLEFFETRMSSTGCTSELWGLVWRTGRVPLRQDSKQQKDHRAAKRAAPMRAKLRLQHPCTLRASNNLDLRRELLILCT